MNSPYKSLTESDVVRGAVTAVFAAVVVGLYGVVVQEGFDLFNTDWTAIFKLVVNAAVGAFFGYLGKNYFTDADGKILGRAV